MWFASVVRTMSTSVVLALASLTGCWYQSSTPTVRAPSAPRAQADYQHVDLAVTGAGIALMGAGAVIAGGDVEETSMPLMVSGAALAGLGGPILHLVHGRGDRALTGYLFRSVAGTAGMVVGWAASCNGGDDRWCGLEGMFWGTTGGLAVGALLDTVFLHGRDDESAAWMPTVSTGDGVTRIGVAGAF